MPLESGARLNHYDVVCLLGAGGMGEVYRATDTKLQRDVALKVLPADVATDPARLQRFRREARAVAALNHPNIVTIHSVEDSGGIHFLTMEFVQGRTLDALLDDGGLGTEQFLAVAIPFAEAVAAAHAAGITHRDLKPQNVMLDPGGRLKVLDFGLAKFGEVFSEEEERSDLTTMLRTEEGVVVGTVPYMSPEQVDGRPVDCRSDVFSMGSILYEMATGRRPFQGKSSLERVVAILRDDPPLVATLAPSLPPALHDVIERCLRKDPAARYPDAAAVLQGLQDVRLPSGREAPTAELRVRPRHERPPLVGRGAEHDTLAAHLRDAAGGTGGLVLLGGEPGVGKTRLAEELLESARDRGMIALTGHCYEAGDTPFSPFVEILEEMVREMPATSLREALGDDAPDIARLAPRIRRVFDDLPDPSQLEPDQQRRVLFNAMLDLFRRLSADEPVVLLLDDLHWADEATVGLLTHLAPHLSEMAVLAIGTYRDAEFDVGKPFEKAMATLVAKKKALRLPVRRLPQAAVAQLLGALGGSEAPSSLVEAIFKETEGNPFFVGEVFQHLSEEGHLFDKKGRWKADLSLDTLEVPEGVRLVIGRRLERMSEETRELLTTAAVVGRQFDLKLVEALSTLDSDAFIEAIEEAEAANLINPEPTGRQTRYAFTHELFRSTLFSALSVPRRQRLQARVAKAMETVYASTPSGHAAAIAHHLYEAGPAADESLTIRFLTLASDQAIETGALENSLHNIERALSLVSDDDPRTRGTLLWKLGLAHRALGQLPDAVQDWETALRLREGEGDRDAIATLCVMLAHSYAWTGQPLLGVTAARRGLAALGSEASSDKCRLLGSLAWNLSLACDFESAAPIMQEALAMADALGDVALRGESVLLSSWHYYLCMRRKEQADASLKALDLLRPTRDLGKIGEALGNLQMASIQIGRPADIADTEAETRTLAERLGRFDVRVHQGYSELLRDWLFQADLDKLDRDLERAQEVAGAWGWLAESHQAQALLWRGRLEAAADRARISVAHEPPISTHTGSGWGMVFLCRCVANRREEALAVLDEHLEGLPRTGKLNTLGSWIALLKVIEGLAILGERDRAAGYHPLVVEALETGVVVAYDASHLLETVAGVAAAAGSHWETAETHYQNALRIADEMPFISEQAEARYWYARMLLDRGGPEDRDQARELLGKALEVYGRIGMPWFVRRCESALSDVLA